MMRLLLMDTCGASGSVALADGEVIVATEVLPGRSASERLVPVVRELLEKRGRRLTELDAIVVVHGPGSFTGVRVGLSAAKGLSEAAGVPLVAVSRLAVLAGLPAVPPFAKDAKGGAPGLYVALDAGRGEFYFGDYRDAENPVEALLTRPEVLAAVGAEAVRVCEVIVAEALTAFVEVRMVAEPVAGDALGIALSRVWVGRFDDAATVDANYLRGNEGLFGRRVAG